MTVTLYCEGRGTHPRIVIYVYDGPVPLPDGWSPFMRSSVFELACDRRKGGCGRSPRPSETDLRTLIERLANTPSGERDISHWDL